MATTKDTFFSYHRNQRLSGGWVLADWIIERNWQLYELMSKDIADLKMDFIMTGEYDIMPYVGKLQ